MRHLNRNRLIGFDTLDSLFDTFGQFDNTYPPHNIAKISKNEYDIEVAVAGYDISEINVQMNDRTLEISKEPDEKESREYIYKGIAERSFKKLFRLHEYVEVSEVTYRNGLLVVHLIYNVPEEKQPKTFEVKQLQ